MQNIQSQRLISTDSEYIELIANWYLQEWSIPKETTINKLTNFPSTGIPFQILMLIDGIPIATGGVYTDVALTHKEPRFAQYSPWLALVYTIPSLRAKGLGTQICGEIERVAIQEGIKEYYLFTSTAESLYKRLNWEIMEHLEVADRKIVVMKKGL